MRKLFQLLTNRLFITGILVLLQIAVLVMILYRLSEYSAMLNMAMSALSLVIVLHIAVNDDNPTFKITWIIPILLLPIFGWAIYLILGRRKYTKKLTARFRENENYFNTQIIQNMEIFAQLPPLPSKLFSYINNVTHMCVFSDTDTLYFPKGDDFFYTYLIELKKAEKFIFIEYFIIEDGKMWREILKILRDKANNGVEIRIMYDDFGTANTLPKNYRNTLESYGFKVAVFNPLRAAIDTVLNYRDHRKITVIDGVTAFTGGLNLADEYINKKVRFGYWKDCAIMLNGGAVNSMTLLFLKLWNFSLGTISDNSEMYLQKTENKGVGFISCFDDGPMDNDLTAEFAYMSVINAATQYVYIITPYLILDNELLTSLKLSAKSGVDVRIITPGIPDKKTVNSVTKANYPALIGSGVRIYEYTPGFIHSKILVADDQFAITGTANFDFRSFYMHYENCVLMYKTEAVAQIKLDFTDTLSYSKEITAEQISSVPIIKRTARSILKLFSPFM